MVLSLKNRWQCGTIARPVSGLSKALGFTSSIEEKRQIIKQLYQNYISKKLYRCIIKLSILTSSSTYIFLLDLTYIYLCDLSYIASICPKASFYSNPCFILL